MKYIDFQEVRLYIFNYCFPICCLARNHVWKSNRCFGIPSNGKSSRISNFEKLVVLKKITGFYCPYLRQCSFYGLMYFICIICHLSNQGPLSPLKLVVLIIFQWPGVDCDVLALFLAFCLFLL